MITTIMRVLWLIALLQLIGPEAFATTCGPDDRTAQQKFEDYSHIFVATITSSKIGPKIVGVKSPYFWIIAKFQVDEAIKGNPRKIKDIRTRQMINPWDAAYRISITSDPADLRPGARFLVFAEGRGSVEAGQCSPTQPVYGQYPLIVKLREEKDRSL